MIEYKYQILQTFVVLFIFLVVQFIARNSVNKMLKRFSFARQRRKIVVKSVNFITVLIATLSIAGIWGIDKSQLMIFISSLLTILGIGFFAQWSILSNITSGLILFFSHPLKIGDDIRIMDKDYQFDAKVEDITYFFLHLLTSDGQRITIPNSIALQKMISIIPEKKSPASKNKPVASKG